MNSEIQYKLLECVQLLELTENIINSLYNYNETLYKYERIEISSFSKNTLDLITKLTEKTSDLSRQIREFEHGNLG